MLDTSTLLRIEDALGRRVVGDAALSGGCVADVRTLTLDGGDRVVAKQGSDGLAIEAAMLAYLRTRTSMPVPAVLLAEDDLLVMEHVAAGRGLGPEAQRHAAELFAALHDVAPDARDDAPAGARAGFPWTTRIGPLEQPNPWSNSWVDFFAEHRLVRMAAVARDAGRLPTTTLRRVEALASRLDRYLADPARPALVHGDAWTGNLLVAPSGDRLAAVIDPALHYGHPEVELAFTTLFGTFGPPFFQRYGELRPDFEPEGFFAQRRELYNLYPLLVHVRLFGGHYEHSVEATLRRFSA